MGCAGREELQVLPEFVPFPGTPGGMSELPPGSAAASREGNEPEQSSGGVAGVVGRHSPSLHGSEPCSMHASLLHAHSSGFWGSEQR